MNASADNWAVMDVNANWFKSFSHALVECFSKLRPTCRKDLSLSYYSIAKVLFSLCYRCMANKCLQFFSFLPDSGMREKVKHLNEFSLWAIKYLIFIIKYTHSSNGKKTKLLQSPCKSVISVFQPIGIWWSLQEVLVLGNKFVPIECCVTHCPHMFKFYR